MVEYSASLTLTGCLQHLPDLIQYRRIVYRRGHLVLRALGDLHHRAAQDLARARLRQPRHHHRLPERRHRPDLVAHKLDGFLADLLMRPVHPGGQAQEAHGQLPLQLVRHPDHRAFGDVGVRGEHLLDCAC